MFGEKYSFDDEICQSIHQMNTDIIKAMDPISVAAVLDFAPFLFRFKFLLRETHRHLEATEKSTAEFALNRIREAKVSKRGSVGNEKFTKSLARRI